MKHIRFFILTISLFVVALATAQTRGVASNAIPSDNKLRYYRLALPVTVSAFEEDFAEDYNNVLQFWRECEEYCNRMFVPLGICFDVVEDNRLIMTQSNDIDASIYNAPSFGTELTDAAIGSDKYDVGMWVHHRDESAENSGLTANNGVYDPSKKSSGYAKADKWVVAHELGHIFGAEYHTAWGEGSIMDNEGEFFSFPSIKLIRTASVNNGTGSANRSVEVTNSAPAFDESVMKNSYRIPQGACMAIPVLANDAHTVTYSAIGCSSANVEDVNGEFNTVPHFKSLLPQTSNVIDYRPKYNADYIVVTGTNIPSMLAGTYDIAFLANDMPASTSYDYLSGNPFYSNYSVWDATVEIVGGTAFNASIRSAKNSYSAGESVTVDWGVNNSYFGTQMLRITMSADYGETFPYVLAESVPATNGTCTVTLPNVNVGNVDVDFVTKTRSMRAGIIRVEEIGGVAYTLTTLSPENGGGFTVTGGSDAPDPVLPTTYTIKVQANPATSGTATVNGNSTATVDAGSTVTLIATANSGYKFDGWYLNSTQVSTSSTYRLSAQGNATYTAKFSAVATPEPEPGQQATDEVSVKAEPAEGGTATVNDKESVTVDDAGSYVYLNATANSGYEFAGWYLNDKKVYEYRFYSLKALPGETYIAKFSKEGGVEPEPEQPTTYAITTAANPTEGGTAKFAVGTGSQQTQGDVNHDELITLYAVANTGYNFVNWTRDGVEVSTVATCNVTATQAANYVANFEIEPAQDVLVDGAVYQILNLNYTNPQKYILDNGNASAQANTMGTDVQNSLWIAKKNSGNCYSLMNGKTNKYLKGTTTQSGAWQMSTDESFVYIYKYNDGQYYISAIELSDITKQSMSCAHNPGDHYNLVTWNNVDDKGELIVPSMWNFVEYVISYTVNVSAENGGTVESTATTVKHGDKVTLTATAPAGYTFDAWYASDGKPVSNENPYTFEVTGNIDYTAKFTQTPVGNTYTITVTRNNVGGLAYINDKNITEGVYSEGAKITLCAVEDVDNSGYLFEGWYKDSELVSTAKDYDIEVKGGGEYEARFERGCIVQALDRSRICQVTIRDNKGNEGAGRLVVRSGEKVTLSAYFYPHYTFQAYYDADGKAISYSAEYEVEITGDVTYFAVAELASYTLMVSTNDKNMGSAKAISGAQEWGEKVEVGYSTPAYLSAIPEEGYIFVNWTLNGVEVSREKEYTVPAITELEKMVDVEYVANFKEKPDVTYSVNVEIVPYYAGYFNSTAKDVEPGGSVTLTAHAYDGYAFEYWSLDGVEVSRKNVLTVNNVTQELRYVANYRVTDPLVRRSFRLKEKSSGLYMDVDHEGEITDTYGQVKISAKNKESEKQIILFEKSGEGYKLKSRSGYYIDGYKRNVNTASEIYESHKADVFMFVETGTASEYKIKWNNINNDGALQYFNVGYVDGQSSGTQYVYCDAVESAAATWILEEVADKSKLVPLIAKATELFNRVANDKTKINIAGKITSNAPHNTADGNTGEFKDGDGYAGLTDDDPSTYFHSRWKGTSVNEAHYLQINLGEGESLRDFIFEYAVRKAADVNNTSPAPTAMEVRVSTDGQNFGDPIAQYAGGTNANSLPAHGDLGKTLWNSGVISAGEKIRHIRLTVTNSAGPGGNKWNDQYFFAMGTLNLYSPQPSLKEEYKDNPAITEEMLVALSTALANANSVNDDDAATTEEVTEAIQTLSSKMETLERVLVPVSFTLAQVTASNLMSKTEPTYIAVKNISGTNNLWFVGTGNVGEFGNSTVLVWEPVVIGQKGSYYIRNTFGKYIQNTSPIAFGGVEGAAVFTAVNATSKGSGETKFNAENENENTLANIDTAEDSNLVRFVTKINGETTWINVEHAGTNKPSIRNNGADGYTVHFVYEATMVNEFTVNVTDAQFATFYAPANVILPDNATVYILDGVKKGNWASLAEVDGKVLAKNTAVLLYSETRVDCKFYVTDAAADAKVDGNKLLGTVQDAYIKKDSEKSYYILSRKNGVVAMYNPVWHEDETKFMNRANRVYLVLDKTDFPQQTAEFLRFLFPGTTAVEEVTTENVAVETIYDLQGRKLTEIASPGIYIINGKKVFVK